MVSVRIKREYNKIFGRDIYVILVNNQKKFFEFTKALAEKKAKRIRKLRKK